MKHNYDFRFESTYRLEADYSLTLRDGTRTRISVRYAVPEYNDREWSLSAAEFERDIAAALNIVRWGYGDNRNPVPIVVFEAFVGWLKTTKRLDDNNAVLTRGRYEPQTGWTRI